MASASLTLYKNNTQTEVLNLVSQASTGASYKVAGRGLSTPISLTLDRKIQSGVSKNDHVVIRLAQTDNNVNTGKAATGQILIDVSIPKDQSILTPARMGELLSMAASALIDNAATGATSVNRTALIDGRDL